MGKNAMGTKQKSPEGRSTEGPTRPQKAVWQTKAEAEGREAKSNKKKKRKRCPVYPASLPRPLNRPLHSPCGKEEKKNGGMTENEIETIYLVPTNLLRILTLASSLLRRHALKSAFPT